MERMQNSDLRDAFFFGFGRKKFLKERNVSGSQN